MGAKQTLQEWLHFAARSGDIRVTGKRAFASALDFVETLEAEAESLIKFARSKRLDLTEHLEPIIKESAPLNSGNEHRVFKVNSQRVLKITHPGKFGRNEHTPFLYLRRWALLNQMSPAIMADFEDCWRQKDGGVSIVMSMAFIPGTHPTSEETDSFIRNEMEFRPLNDSSSTLDYVSKDGRLILRDCHPRNWIKRGNTLIPIDIIPEEPVS